MIGGGGPRVTVCPLRRGAESRETPRGPEQCDSHERAREAETQAGTAGGPATAASDPKASERAGRGAGDGDSDDSDEATVR